VPWSTLRVRRSAPGKNARLAAGVRAIYRRLDRKLTAFRRRSGLACLPGCGECCRSTEVEATVLELLPLALDLCRRGKAEEILDRLRGSEEPERCLLFSERPLGRSGGHCTAYSWRPLLCRLFGFSSMENREGRPELVACRLVRAADPGLTEEAAVAAAQGRPAAPLMRDCSMAVYRLDPVLGSGALPVNVALRQALERVALASRLRGKGCIPISGAARLH
jgi:Fe-S-cluster containining protein